jgi:hypothetical protein
MLTGRRMLAYAVAVIAAGSCTAAALVFIHPRSFTYLEYLRHSFLRLYLLCLLEAGVSAALLAGCLLLMRDIFRFKSPWAWVSSGALFALGLVWGLGSLGTALLGRDFTSLNLWLFIAVGGPQFLTQIGALWVSALVGAVTALALYFLDRTGPLPSGR